LYPDGHPEYRYICQSNKEFAPAAFGAYSISLNEPQKMNFEFSNGFLTLPLLKGTPIKVNAYFDEGNNTNWMNQPNGDSGHQGTDFGVPIGTPVVAAAPGKVKFIQDMGPVGLFPVISHEEFARETLSTLYAHMSKVEVSEGQQVYRGQRIGLSGEDKTHPGPHLHFELDRGYWGGQQGSYTPLDPYASRWKSDPDSIGFWTKKDAPQFSV